MKPIFYLTIISATLFLNGCKKTPEKPPVRDLSQGTFYSAAQLRSIASCTDGCNNRFTDEAYFKGVVVADEVSGNFYKEIYVRDAANTGGIHMTFTVSGSNLFIGDSVRLNMKGYDVNLSSGMVEIDSVNFEKNVVKFASGANPQPRVISLSDITSANPYSNYLCDLVTIRGVSFLSGDTNKIWADPILQQSLNHSIQDCGGNQVVVRTSNYALFAQQKTPKGYGSITGIATAYNTTNQLMIRIPSEVDMNGPVICYTYHSKNFNDNSITSGGWSNVSITNPAVTWTTSTFGTVTYAKISGFIGTNQNAESWLVSPAIDLSSSYNPILTFQTAAKFAGNPLEVWVTTSATANPGTSSWTQLTGFALGAVTPGYVWTGSGAVSLSGYKSTTTRIGFRYTSTTTGATTYELDDVVIREN